MSRLTTGIFVPSLAGFKELTDVPELKSVNAVMEHMGYDKKEEYFSYWGDKETQKDADIYAVVFETFTRNIIYVGTKETESGVDPNKLKFFLKNLTDEELFDSLHIDTVLTNGVENKSLTIEFLARVLGLEDTEPSGVYFSDKLDMYLHFNDGVLVDFQPSDGLNEWAKWLKNANPALVKSYESNARRFWGNNNKQVLNEVNVQASAFSGVPKSFQNEFIPLHKDASGLVNYHMLLVSHYGQKITLPEFLTINHGRHEKLLHQPNEDVSVYRLGKFNYIFGQDGSLHEAVLR